MGILLVSVVMSALVISADSGIQNRPPAQSPDFIKSNELNSAAVKLFNEGRSVEAQPLAMQALELREKVVGPADPALIPLLTNLGEIWKQTDLAQSANYFSRALKLADADFGPSDIRLIAILDRLAFVEYSQKHVAAGEELFVRSLKIKDAKLRPDDPEIAETAFNLGQAYAARGNYKGAARMVDRAVDIWEKAGEKYRPRLAKALDSQVFIFAAMGKSQEATRAQSRLAQLSADTPIISGGVVNSKALVAYVPEYPSVSFHQSGEVRVSVLIDENGSVLTAIALPSRLAVEYTRAAVEAAKRWRFTPTFVDGKPMKVNGIIVFNFVARH